MNNPFPVRAHFRFSFVLIYSLPASLLEPLLVPGLELDHFGNSAFLAVAMVRTERLRPAFFPPLLGRDFFLVGYRVFVRYRTREGRQLRGLKIIESLTDKGSMNSLGNFFTAYRYRHAEICHSRTDEELLFEARNSSGGLEIRAIADLTSAEVPLPVGSVFSNWREARRFAGPMPFTFSYDERKHSISRVEGVRQHWAPRPVAVREASVAYLQRREFEESARLASAFLVEDVPYYWKRGLSEPL